MLDRADIFLAKALESLTGAESELANGRYNNCANRAYYACYQAAVAALYRADVRPPRGGDEWSHSFVAAQFDGVLINRRKLYAAYHRNAVAQNHILRVRADYEDVPVSQPQANRALRRARDLVRAVETRGHVTS